MERKFLLMTITLLLGVTNARTDDSCEARVTNTMKLDMIKDSITTARTLMPKGRDADEHGAKCSRGDRALAHINLALVTLNGFGTDMEVDDDRKHPECPKCPPMISGSVSPVDCSEIYKRGYQKSGVYIIYPKSLVSDTKPIKVYCDMDTDGGGWTVIQRRSHYMQQTDFNQYWNTYKEGFGNISRDFWLGNDNIFTLTNQGVYSIRIDLKNHRGEHRYSKHDHFWIGDEDSNYVLNLYNFTGNVSDDFSRQNRRMFSTKDRQNDGHASYDACAIRHNGAWWWPSTSGCGHLNLNGVYLPGQDNKFSVWWWDWQRFVGLSFVEMKIRPRYVNLNKMTSTEHEMTPMT